MPPRLVVFDLDGTLVDSRRDLADAANAVLASCGARRLPEESIGAMVGEGAAVLVARAFAAAGAPQPVDALERFLLAYSQRLLAHTRPYPGVAELLAWLRPRAALAVLTNKPLSQTRELLAGLALAPHFDDESVIGGDGPLPRKPAPDGLLRLCERSGAAPAHALMVGDSAIDLRTARNAGVPVCLARYGFGAERIGDEARLAQFEILLPGDLIAVFERNTLR
jgi:phosphoglycolate phosphatase